ncbi:hypothetical protein [Pseudomonas wadenswilerensis]|uniref:hypothetical protein n=1 Tax=Pseudomonas wadenswilerensis TaxID=1785161 RepID=UPI003B8315A1
MDEKIAAGKLLMKQALDASRRYHEARDSLTAAEEVESLRLEAELLMTAVQEYMRRVLGGEIATRH